MKKKTQAERSLPLTDDEFWHYLVYDLEQAKGQVLINSPFLFERRAEEMLRNVKALVERGVTVCVYLKQPAHWGSNTPVSEETAIEHKRFEKLSSELRKVGAHVNIKFEIHQKIVVIDRKILYEGSLNTLSQRMTAENMRRFSNPDACAEMIKKHGLDYCRDCVSTELYYTVTSKTAAARLRHLRRSLRLSQAAVASQSGLTRQLIWNIEQGNSTLLSNYEKFANVLGYKLILIPEPHAQAICHYAEVLTKSKIVDGPAYTKPPRAVYTQIPKRFEPRQST